MKCLTSSSLSLSLNRERWGKGIYAAAAEATAGGGGGAQGMEEGGGGGGSVASHNTPSAADLELVSDGNKGWLAVALPPRVWTLFCHAASKPGCDKDTLAREVLAAIVRSGDDFEWQSYYDDELPASNANPHGLKMEPLLDGPDVAGLTLREESSMNAGVSPPYTLHWIDH